MEVLDPDKYGDGDGDGDGYGDGSDINLIHKFKFHPDIILNEKNAERRHKMIEGYGLIQLIQAVGAETIEKDDTYELLNFNINGTFRPYLKMLNPSTGCWHIEGVHPSCDTIEKALVWRNGTSEKPEILT